jgi:hypothetical protein
MWLNSGMADFTPKTFWQILEENNRQGHFNFSFNNLIREHTNHNDLEDKSYSVSAAINRILLGEGQREFIHLSPRFQEVMVAISLLRQWLGSKSDTAKLFR